jgi:hypothetical protein
MHPYEAAQASNAFKTKSVSLYEVSTFPPTTAAVADGFKKQFSGKMISIGFKHP